MKSLLNSIQESARFSIQALVVNRLRTVLSLLGVTIGIFAIIAVFTLVDTMKNGIRDNIESLGTNVVFVQKWPWSFGSDYPWWKYINRPMPNLRELAEVSERCESAEASAFVINKTYTAKAGNSSMEGVSLVAASHQYDQVRNFELALGRYFTEAESRGGRAVGVIGTNVALGLFGFVNPIGKTIRLGDAKVEVIGIFKQEGESMIGYSTDDEVLVPVNYAGSILDLRSPRLNQRLMVKAAENVPNAQLIDELTGIIRSVRRLKPRAEDNFALNETSILSQSAEGLFLALSVAGLFIGGFSVLVGGFGIANIMFVSVKERTNQIGIQKSLGAKRSFILFQFLFEAIFLCLVGGAIGLTILLIGSLVIMVLFDTAVAISASNVLIGLSISLVIGLVAGIVPAYIASRLNPVEAIRAN